MWPTACHYNVLVAYLPQDTQTICVSNVLQLVTNGVQLWMLYLYYRCAVDTCSGDSHIDLPTYLASDRYSMWVLSDLDFEREKRKSQSADTPAALRCSGYRTRRRTNNTVTLIIQSWSQPVQNTGAKLWYVTQMWFCMFSVGLPRHERTAAVKNYINNKKYHDRIPPAAAVGCNAVIKLCRD